MGEDKKTLGERALACGMRWVRGMVGSEGFVCVTKEGVGWTFWRMDVAGEVEEFVPDTDPMQPDIEHPANQGCILAQASERWVAGSSDSPDSPPRLAIDVVRVPGGWRWRLSDIISVSPGGGGGEVVEWSARGPIVPTYGEACVSALEGSPS